MKQIVLSFIFSFVILYCYSEVIKYNPKPISKELADTYIKELWFHSPYSTPASVEIQDGCCMIAHYSDVKDGYITGGRATKDVSKIVFFREIGRVILKNTDNSWHVLLKNKSDGGLRNFKCKDEELAKGFIDAIYYYIKRLPKE